MRGFEIVQHTGAEHAHFADDRGHLGEHIVHQDRGIGKDDAFDGTVGDVALMPECDVLIRGDHIGSNEARETPYLLAGDRVAFVRHRGTSALLPVERLLGFTHFSPLQMANFERDFFERGSDQRERTHVVRVTIALDYLRRYRRDREALSFADPRFRFWPQMRSVAHRAGNLAYRHLLRGVA